MSFIIRFINNFIDNFSDKFYQNIIAENRWQLIIKGLLITLEVTFFAVLLGIVIGFVVAIIRSTYETTVKPNLLFKIINFISKVYLTVIRGTPVIIQLLIVYFVIFASVDINKVVAAVIAFGINSGAYVAEIVRSGIMSVDKGQFEAGRSLGLNYFQTMITIVLPQALKNILPALGNEFIVLLKETSVSGYIALMDLTKAADTIRSRTYEAFFPLLTAAFIYLILVMILSAGVTRLERWLRKSDRR
ncbi:MAG: amino acid ABC transporter permease [Oscillospiraceae bacterium]|nr:amino acid ABC transporter permease [Oscillospiraceae bacterium]MDD4413736.1 amino acid ABC transporter permease [Oscillospiraceae bacterium]